MQHLTIAAALDALPERHRLLLLGAMKAGAQLHASTPRPAVVGWHLAVAHLLEAEGAARRRERASVALDAAGLLAAAATQLDGRELEAVACGLFVSLEQAPSPAVADFLLNMTLILDDENRRRGPVAPSVTPA